MLAVLQVPRRSSSRGDFVRVDLAVWTSAKGIDAFECSRLVHSSHVKLHAATRGGVSAVVASHLVVLVLLPKVVDHLHLRTHKVVTEVCRFAAVTTRSVVSTSTIAVDLVEGTVAGSPSFADPPSLVDDVIGIEASSVATQMRVLIPKVVSAGGCTQAEGDRQDNSQLGDRVPGTMQLITVAVRAEIAERVKLQAVRWCLHFRHDLDSFGERLVVVLRRVTR